MITHSAAFNTRCAVTVLGAPARTVLQHRRWSRRIAQTETVAEGLVGKPLVFYNTDKELTRAVLDKCLLCWLMSLLCLHCTSYGPWWLYVFDYFNRSVCACGTRCGYVCRHFSGRLSVVVAVNCSISSTDWLRLDSVVHSVYTVLTDLCFTSVTYLFIFSLLALTSQNRRMGSSWICYEQFGVWCNFNILWLDSLPCPPVFREVGKLPQILPKIWRCPNLVSWSKQTAQCVKTGK